ncbi:SHOCT domain-containing protein [Gordonia sp. ABSL49_1]|uniref:SHOCT domain-containing protein n=1 Tax=unclassified Gordonia (in: high G+C Gram-positive bacteria) TaxID=2657482 RepID=UPI001F0F5D63|nr:SHOCT domain-containing protein [Gordonia sp. ABSL49_1]MCH5641488.1 SHOCT domain-containing protein [Gordonia sp. ABSL49_1]
MPGLIRGVARTAVIAGTATAVSNRVSRRQANRWSQQAYDQEARAAYEQQQYAQPQQPQYQQPAPAPAAPAASTVDQLKELAALYQQGILTEDEFAAQKAKILAS